MTSDVHSLSDITMETQVKLTDAKIDATLNEIQQMLGIEIN